MQSRNAAPKSLFTIPFIHCSILPLHFPIPSFHFSIIPFLAFVLLRLFRNPARPWWAVGSLKPGENMSSYDSADVFYDSGIYWDDFVPPHPIRRNMAKAKLGLDSMTPDALAAFAITIKAAMTGNANFPAPNPTLAALGTAITTLQTKIAAYNTSLTSSDTALAERVEATLALRAALTQEAAYVDNASGGDRVKIESA